MDTTFTHQALVSSCLLVHFDAPMKREQITKFPSKYLQCYLSFCSSCPLKCSFFHALKLSGKWHQGVNCESFNDHCHHPLNHGFDYFYGMLFTLLNNCQENKPPELDVALQAKLWLYSQIIAFAVLTLAAGRLTGLVSIRWKIIACFTLAGCLFFISWYSSYGFVQRWNCILMRNHDITEQPMRLERTASLMLKEAISFIKR